MRCFVALPVPDHVRVLAAAATAPARDAAPELSWTRPEGWHVTLAFLGEVPDDRVPAVEDVVAGTVTAADGPIELALDTPGRFRHDVLWYGVRDDPSGAVGELAERIQAALETAGLPVQRRRARPHLTLARASRRDARVDDEVVDAVAHVAVRWEADEVALVRSVLGKGPARYEPVGAWPLRASAG